MSTVFFLYLLYIQFSINICDIAFFNKSNCSLSFQVQTISQSNKIQTDFPIDLIGNYNLTCNIKNFIAYYKITPLSILIIGKYKNEKFESMIEFHTTEFKFNINQSSTIRLCILSIDDNEYCICRAIHIGINRLYNFWNFPMKIFYICLICSISIYYILYILLNKWYRNERKLKTKLFLLNEKFIQKNDTFENEKVHKDMSAEE